MSVAGIDAWLHDGVLLRSTLAARRPLLTAARAAAPASPVRIDNATWGRLRAALVSNVVKDADFASRVDTWNRCLPQFEINTVRGIAAFLGNCSAESGFAELAENMNYSAPQIVKVWPRRFTTVADARPYEHNPEKLGNKVYSNRMGNGDEASGDGYRFRGHGDIQTTGRDAFTRFGKLSGRPPEGAVDYAATPVGAIEVSCWEWRYNMVNRHGEHCADLAEAWDMSALTLLINGGDNGLDRRITQCAAAFRIIAAANGVSAGDYPPGVTPH